jgi:hypothetical protein
LEVRDPRRLMRWIALSDGVEDFEEIRAGADYRFDPA